MSMSGWIKLHRKVLHSDMYKALNSKQRDVMMTCLLLANHSEKQWEYDGDIYKCLPGQFVTSLQKLADLCGKDVKVQSVRTALLKLEKWGFLTNKSTKQNRLVTICKWDTYQQEEEDTNKEVNRQLTNDQQRTNKRLTTNKNVKNEENDNNNNNRAFVADVDRDKKGYRQYLYDIIYKKPNSRDQLFLNCKINTGRRTEIWEDFIKNAMVHTPLIEDDKHAWNTFKKFILDHAKEYSTQKRESGAEAFTGF